MNAEQTAPSSITARNWGVLRKLALSHLVDLRVQHPAWSLEDLMASKDLPGSAFFFELAKEAGFRLRQESTPEELVAVAQACIRGARSEDLIAKETGLPSERITQILGSFAQGYGQAPFGIAPYGGSRRFSDGRSMVPRRITSVGQLSYRGHTYTLGAAYRNRIAMLVERGSRLTLTFADRPPLDLASRHYKPV